MSLFDPNTNEERLQQLANDGWWSGSGSAIPQLSDADIRHLEIELDRIGVQIFRSPDRENGWEDAYAVFANAFLRTGTPLTEPLLHVDIPNMLFNFGLKSGWFPHLTLQTEGDEPFHLLSPKRFPIEHVIASEGSRFHEQHNRRQQLGWYKQRIRPAVTEWTAKAKESKATVRQAAETTTVADLWTAIELIRESKKRSGLSWPEYAGKLKMSETTLRQRVCEPDFEKQIKAETLLPLVEKFQRQSVGPCDTADFNFPKKNERKFKPLPPR